MDAGQQLHQSGLSRTIFAHHRVDLTAANIKTHVVERGHTAKAL